jgi:hypothetical protein
VLVHSTDADAVGRAADELLRGQSHYGEDLTMAVPALVTGLVQHPHKSGWLPGPSIRLRRCDLGRDVVSGLEAFAARGSAQRALLLECLQRLPPKQRRPEHKDLLLLLHAP